LLVAAALGCGRREAQPDHLGPGAQIVSVDGRHVRLADGRRVELAGVRCDFSGWPLDEVFAGGLEIAGDGRVKGVIPVWFGCGNGDVRTEWRRVDARQFLDFVCISAASEPEPAKKVAAMFSPGLMYAAFLGYSEWESDSAR